MVQNYQESRCMYWATRTSIRSLAPLTHSRARGKVNDSVSRNDLVLSHSGLSTFPFAFPLAVTI